MPVGLGRHIGHPGGLGHAQAPLLNYEVELVSKLSQAASMATTMRFPVFIGSFTDQGAGGARARPASFLAASCVSIHEPTRGVDGAGSRRMSAAIDIVRDALAPWPGRSVQRRRTSSWRAQRD